MGFFKELKKEKINNIYDSIYFDSIIDNSIIKSINNKYIKCYEISDINYLLSDKEGKVSILEHFMQFFNGFDKDIGISFYLTYKKNIENYYYEEMNDKYLKLRKAINSAIDDNIYKKNQSNIIKKFLFIDISEKNDEDAINRFNIINDVVKEAIYNINGVLLKELKEDKLLKLLYLAYNQENRVFYRQNEDMFSSKNILSLDLSYKDVIMPKRYEVQSSYMRLNDTYMKMLYLHKMNKSLNDTTINDLLSTGKISFNEENDITLCIKVRQIDKENAISMAKKELGNVEGDIFRTQTQFGAKNVSNDLIPRSFKQRREEALYINDSLMKRDENLFYLSMYAIVTGSSKKELENNTYRFIKKGKNNGLYFLNGIDLEEHIFNSCLPYGINQTPYTIIVDTESLCGFNIFNAVDIIDIKGDYYGKNKLTNNPIKYDIMSGDNFSQLILGTSGKGKSFTAKLQLILRMLRKEERNAVIIDATGEWRPVVDTLGGYIIDIKSAGNQNINLFDIDTAYGKNPIAEKEELILSVCALMLRKDLSAGQRTTISIAINNIYKKWNEEKIADNIPALEDFSNELKKIIFSKKQYESSEINNKFDNKINYLLDTNFINGEFVNNEDIELLKAIMYYSETSNCTLFRGKSTVSMNAPLICFDLKDLSNDLKPLAMEVVCDMIWLRICKNLQNRVPTDVIIDEFHLMFRDKSTSVWMSKYWKMLRKHLGCPLGITQNPNDVLRSDDGRDVINNTGFSILLSLEENDRKLAKENWKLTDEDINYITDKNRGEGIIIFGASKNIRKKTIIPFENNYLKDNYIYGIVNTSYDEIEV